MTRLKSGMLVSAALRHAAAELIDCVLIRRGDADAGAIFLHIDARDGRHKLVARTLDFDGNYSWRSIMSGANDSAQNSGDPQNSDDNGWVTAAAVDARLAREIEMDPDAFVLEVVDEKARNPFDLAGD